MKNFILNHKGAVIGGAVGFVMALLILIIGFWKAFLVLLLIGAGVLIGMATDGNNIIKTGVNKFKSSK